MFSFWNKLGENVKRVYIPAHVLVLFGLFSVFSGGTNWLWLLLIYPSWFLFGHIGYGIFVHRYYCHKSFETYTWIARLGAFFSLLSGAGSVAKVKVLHMGYHHPYSDTELDPHTPTKGLWWSYFQWQNHKFEIDKKKLWAVKDVLKDPYLRFLHNHNYKIYWGCWLLLALIDWRLAVFVISAGTVLEFHLLSTANTFGHYKHKWSYQNYPDRDNSQNIPWLNWVTLGHGLHNNHHGRPGAYNTAHKKGEFDLTAWIVPLIEKKKEK